MKKIAVFPGSFSPLTKGHKSIIDRMIPLISMISDHSYWNKFI